MRWAVMALVLLGGSRAVSAGAVDELLRALDSERLTRPDSARIVRFSSADPSGGNSDGFQARGALEAALRRDAGGWVLAEAEGPGRLVRLWMTQLDKVERLRFYFDHEPAPRIDLTPAELFDGRVFPFLGSLVGNERRSSGGFISYVPLPFARHLKVIAIGAVRFYQIDLRLEAEGTPVESYDPERWAGESAIYESVLASLDAWDQEPAGLRRHTAHRLAAGERRVVRTLSGAGLIHALRFRLDPELAPESLELWLQIRWDGAAAPCVDLPLAELLISRTGSRSIHGLMFRTDQNEFDLAWKMPFADGAELALENRGPLEQGLELTDWVEPSLPGAVAPLRFHAAWNGSGAPGANGFELVRLAGEGTLVGVQLALAGGRSLEYLESDETIVVDGREAEALQGTGVEDFFNGGFFFSRGAFTQLLHGCPLKIAQRLALYRHLVPDAVPFQRSLEVRFEPPPTGESVAWSGLALWYQKEPHPPARLEPQRAAGLAWPDLAATGSLAAAELVMDRAAGNWVQAGSDGQLLLQTSSRRWAAFYFLLSRSHFGRIWMHYRERPGRPRLRASLGATMIQLGAAEAGVETRPERLDLGCVDLKAGLNRLLVILEPTPSRGMSNSIFELLGIQMEAEP